jgi:mannose-6-phosphate isomerase-like protein (cupin superfamily)
MLVLTAVVNSTRGRASPKRELWLLALFNGEAKIGRTLMEVRDMQKINTNDLPAETWPSADGKFVLSGKEISEALGRVPRSTDPIERHPFDVEIQHIPAGAAATVFHSHSAQWEFYHVLSGGGTVRHDSGTESIFPGDAFIFKPGEAHQLLAGPEGLVMYVIADNPLDDRPKRFEPAP